MTWQRSLHGFSVVFLVLTLAGPGSRVRAQQWYESYEKGLTELGQNRFREAVAQFTLAIDTRPESKANARMYGVRFTDYFPYVYRGIAYARLGETALATKDFEREHTSGEVYNGHRDTKAGALLRERLDNTRPSTPARTKSSDPSRRAGPREPATDLARGSLKDGRQQLDTLFNAAVEAFGRGNFMRAKELFLSVLKRAPTYPGLDGYLSRIRTIEQDTKKGIAAYLNGRYADAVAALTPSAQIGIDNAAAQAFLGCSHAALYLLSGGEVSVQQEKAIEAFRRVKRINPRFKLDTTYVSPAIREIFTSVPAE